MTFYMTFYMTFFELLNFYTKRKSPEGKSCEALGVFSTEYNQNNVLTYFKIRLHVWKPTTPSASMSRAF